MSYEKRVDGYSGVSGVQGGAGTKSGRGERDGGSYRLPVLPEVRCTLPHCGYHPQSAAPGATPLVRAIGYPRLRGFPYLYTGDGNRGSGQFGLEFIVDGRSNIL